MSNLLPTSIQATNTNALDATFLYRLNMLGVQQLLIDLENETDLKKLSLYLQQFGIPYDLIPKDINAIQFRLLLQRIIHIYKLSGSVKSIEMLAIASGASAVTVLKDTFKLQYNAREIHKYYQQNRGVNFRKFTVDVLVLGVSSQRQVSYSETFKELFYLFQPINVYLNAVIFE